jgi:hypothetical protein
MAAPVASAAAPGPSGPATVEQAAERAEAASRRLAEFEARLIRLEVERDQILSEHLQLSQRQQVLASQLRIAQRDVRQLAVSAYVSGGPSGNTGRLLEATEISQVAWRAALIEGQTDLTVASARRYSRLLSAADAAVRELVQRADQNSRKLEQAQVDRFLAGLEDKSAEQDLARARAAARNGATTRAAGDAGDDAWARLRHCESSGNYQALSPSGRYRGAYQFDFRTWESVGGTGDPVDASPEEQDLRARILYARRGSQPWPVCGRFLP